MVATALAEAPPFVVTNGDQSRAGVTYTAAFAVTNARFTNGVLYVNGRYEPNGHFVNYLGTAPIKDLRYESFTVGLDFYPLPKKRSRNSFNRLEAKLDSWTRGRYARWRGVDANLYNTLASLYNQSLSEHPKFPRRHFLWPAVILILVGLMVSLFLWRRIRRYRPYDSQVPKPA